MAQRVTIQDIADELGLSRNTVSKALNQAEGIAEATRAQVFAKAAEMGYKQFAFMNLSPGVDENARDLRPSPNGPSEIALLTMSFISNSHFATPMLDAFQYKLSQMGYTLNTHRVSLEDAQNLRLPVTFSAERAAAILCIELFDPQYVAMVCDLGLPMLMVDGPAKTHGEVYPSDQLYMENYAGITTLVHMLAHEGKTRIGFVGNFRHCQSFYERYVAYRQAMYMTGLAIDERFVIPYNYDHEVGPIIEELGEVPEVFICANDFIAIDTLRALRGYNYDVPEDVWLAGFDDSSESRICMPPLTTVHIHTQGMAYSAVELLTSRMEEASLEYRQVYTNSDLIVRASTPFERL